MYELGPTLNNRILAKHVRDIINGTALVYEFNCSYPANETMWNFCNRQDQFLSYALMLVDRRYNLWKVTSMINIPMRGIGWRADAVRLVCGS